jgi:DNA-binding HxlR family transcriptional regulator
MTKLKLKADIFSAACPSRALLARIANKWSMLVIDALGDESVRNGALLRRIEGVSQKMLTETLRELEEMAIVERRSMGTVPPHVEYRLTPLGLSLRDAVCRLDRWVEENMQRLERTPTALETDRRS